VDVVGHGESRPLVTGAGESAWSVNRRVEFILIRHREVPQ
jgi:outer membrane protein OmpA-like peptidoglycan-associated protein